MSTLHPTECDICQEPGVVTVLNAEVGGRLDFCGKHWQQRESQATLHPTAQAVMRCTEDWSRHNYEDTRRMLRKAVDAWIAAGRPGVAPAAFGPFVRPVPPWEDKAHADNPQSFEDDALREMAKQAVRSKEETEILAALRECRELGLNVELFHDGGASVRCKTTGIRYTHNTLPEARDAYKAAHAPKDEFDENQYDEAFAYAKEHGLAKLFRDGKHVASVVIPQEPLAPECPPPPKGGRVMLFCDYCRVEIKGPVVHRCEPDTTRELWKRIDDLEAKVAADRQTIEAAQELRDDGPPIYYEEVVKALVCLRCSAVMPEQPHKEHCKWAAFVRALEGVDRG